jgi:hypothetical protein
MTTENKYRVVNIRNNATNGLNAWGVVQTKTTETFLTDPWSISAVSRRFLETEIINNLMQKYPSVFSHDTASIPLNVDIVGRSESKTGAWSIFCPYIVSLGILPAWTTTSNQCDVIVTRGNDKNSQQICSIDFQSKNKLTVFSPIGLIAYEPELGAISSRTGEGLMKAPHLGDDCLNDLQVVFTETLAAAIVTCIKNMESVERRPVVTEKINVAPEKLSAVLQTSTPALTTQRGTLEEKLKQLKSLKDSGVLTEQEYETKKNALLDAL